MATLPLVCNWYDNTRDGDVVNGCVGNDTEPVTDIGAAACY